MAEKSATAMAQKRAREMCIELDTGEGCEEDMPKFGSLEGTHVSSDGRILIDTDRTESAVTKTLARAMTSDVVEQMRHEAGRKKAETVEERRVERRNRRMKRHVEDAKDKFEVKEQPKKKPPRKDMIRKKKFKEIGQGSGIKPLLGADSDATISEAADMVTGADDFAAGLVASLGAPFAAAAARFSAAAGRTR